MELFRTAPLAERMRPRNLTEVLGQEHLLGKDGPFASLPRPLPSIVFHGPPGAGKTTLARLLTDGAPFYSLSAVMDGLGELRKILDTIKRDTQRPVLFVDEIHRWNRSQQDSLLPHMEEGLFTLIGATTEHPSLSLVPPLLSRLLVYSVRALEENHIRELLLRALTDQERGLGAKHLLWDEEALTLISAQSRGDGRKALTILESAARLNFHISSERVISVLQENPLAHSEDQHYDLLSAWIKSMRGSDADGALYYFARLYEAGVDPKQLSRRLVIFSAEDVGLADPRALPLAVAAAEAYERVGHAEGWIPLAEAVTYLAVAPKSNSSYGAYKKVREWVKDRGDLPVPLHLRNAGSSLKKIQGYGKGYEYAHDLPEGRVSHSHLPEELSGMKAYIPGTRGFERLLFSKPSGESKKDDGPQ
jgi:putative ATPase